ncbi:MAG: Gfo/Idh/MocA family oxidoreductase [Saprospiraceae bacterium]|nr:Gfo/Idh/MocA family oxidoreductase [Saprospiraceae bacterium]
MKQLNVGLIGFGLSGRYLIAPYLMVNPLFRLKTVVQQRAATAAEIYPSVNVVKDLNDVLTDKDIDLVIVSSPNETHFDYTRRALLSGKHVLVEKPMASTAAECEILIDLAERQGKVLSVYQNRRFDGDFQTVQNVIKNKLVGDVFNYEARFDRWAPQANPKKWKETPSLITGVLYDLGAHILDQALVLFGSPKSFNGQVMTQRADTTIDDAFDLRLDYGQLKVTLKASLLVREPTPRYMVHGTKGSFVKYGIDPQEDMLKAGMTPDQKGFGEDTPQYFGTLNTDINGLHVQGKIETLKGDFGLLFQNLYDTIVNGNDLAVKPEQVLEQIKIMETIKKRSK